MVSLLSSISFQMELSSQFVLSTPLISPCLSLSFSFLCSSPMNSLALDHTCHFIQRKENRCKRPIIPSIGSIPSHLCSLLPSLFVSHDDPECIPPSLSLFNFPSLLSISISFQTVHFVCIHNHSFFFFQLLYSLLSPSPSSVYQFVLSSSTL